MTPRKYGLDSFSPVGLHVLLVDDDPLCLMILDTMLRKCHYRVTACNHAGTALRLLRDGPEEFDLVLSDVCMPDVDGFKLLKIVGLELDLPVIRAVPKKLLEIMNVRGLTREHVASHLQKYRLYLKRLSGTVPEPCPIASFQASKDGMSGTMRVIPGGKNSNSNSVVKGLKLRVGMGGSIKSLEGIVAMDINSEAQVKVCEPRSLEKCVREEAVGELAVSNHRSSPSGDTWQEEPDTCLQSHNKPQKDASDCGQSGPDLLFDMPNVCVEESTIVGIERGARFLLQNRDTGICVKDPEDLSDSDFSSHLKATPLPSIIGEQIAVNKNDSNCSSLDESVSDECSHDNLIFYQQDQSSDVICQEEVNVLDYLVEDPFILDG